MKNFHQIVGAEIFLHTNISRHNLYCRIQTLFNARLKELLKIQSRDNSKMNRNSTTFLMNA